MREILFRGMRKDNGAWVEGAFCAKDCNDPFGPMVDKPSIIKYEEPLSGFWFEVLPETVGQFTGRIDKHGKKVFEGDILRLGSCNYVCFWDGCNFKFGMKNKTESMGIAYATNDLEVVGNIHDNMTTQGCWLPIERKEY